MALLQWTPERRARQSERMKARNSHRGPHPAWRKLTEDDTRLLLACKAERERLRAVLPSTPEAGRPAIQRQINELTNAKLAAKFEVALSTLKNYFSRVARGG